MPITSVAIINSDTVSSVAAAARVELRFIFFVSLSNSSERLFTSFSRSAPALFNTMSLMPLMLSRKYALKDANSARYLTPLSLSLDEEIIGTTIPITRYATTAASARYQDATNPTNKNTAVDTNTAIAIGEIVCA